MKTSEREGLSIVMSPYPYAARALITNTKNLLSIGDD